VNLRQEGRTARLKTPHPKAPGRQKTQQRRSGSTAVPAADRTDDHHPFDAKVQPRAGFLRPTIQLSECGKMISGGRPPQKARDKEID